METGRADIDVFSPVTLLAHQFLDSLEHSRFSLALLRSLLPE